jgi:hypothetical protein
MPVLDWIREGGWPVYLNLLFGPLGLVFGLSALVLSRQRTAALVLGGGAALLGVLAGAVGIVGWLLGRSVVDAAVVGADPSTAELLREMGYEEASHALLCGGVAGALPLAAGALALVLAVRRSASAA